MAFDDVRLPEDVEFGARVGPSFQTTVTPLSSGGEQVNIDWSESRLKADIGYGIQSMELFEEVRSFFYARRGRGRYFRFKDWSDYELDEVIAEGDGSTTVFQIVQVHGPDDDAPYVRRITRPVAATVRVYVDGVLKTVTTDYTLDEDTGQITFGAPPANDKEIRVVCEFDVPVRFDTDEFTITIEGFRAGVVQSLMIIERRE